MARSKIGKPGYKGNLPASLVGKEGALRTKLMILKGRKLEAQEKEEDTTEIDRLIDEAETEQAEVEETVKKFMKEVA